MGRHKIDAATKRGLLLLRAGHPFGQLLIRVSLSQFGEIANEDDLRGCFGGINDRLDPRKGTASIKMAEGLKAVHVAASRQIPIKFAHRLDVDEAGKIGQQPTGRAPQRHGIG